MADALQTLVPPLKPMFEEMRSRLDPIPTSSQRASVRARAATQSWAATANRPTDYILLPASTK